MAQIHLRLKELYQEGGRRLPRSDPQPAMALRRSGDPTAEEIAKEINGRALGSVTDTADPTKVLVEAGKLLPGFAALRDDGSTSCGCWIYSGCFNENGNNMARRDTSDPDETGAYSKWAFAWPANRRILYNRASADLTGKAWDPTRKLIEWDGAEMDGLRHPGHRADGQARRGRSVHHEPGRRLAPLHPGHDARRAVPGALRAVRVAHRQSGRAQSPWQPGGAGVRGRPGAVRRSRFAGIPLCGDLLSPDRAFPLLDQARRS